jgi:ornithine cyclodeaminase
MAARILYLEEIQEVVAGLDLLPAIEEGYALYSARQAVVPPVGELLLDKGEVHIKYGYIHSDPYYVIKIASGFYSNPELGLSSSNGLMLLFDQQTGELVSILLDEGYLTDVRTAIGGAIAAKHLAPRKVNRIGIVGTGIQAALQLLYLRQVVDCRDVLVWVRGDEQLIRYREKVKGHGFNIETTRETADILNTCNLVVTTTPSTSPLLQSTDIPNGVHITAVGSDTPDKQELDAAILKRADVVAADSISQCLQRGEIYQAVKTGLQPEKLMELGNIIEGLSPGRISDQQITVADMTGVAVQDIKIAEAVYRGRKGA